MTAVGGVVTTVVAIVGRQALGDDLGGAAPHGGAELVDGVSDGLEGSLGGRSADLEGCREVLDGAGGNAADGGGLLFETGTELLEVAAVGLDDGLGSGGYSFDETAEAPGGRRRVRVRVCSGNGGGGLGVIRREGR